MAKLKPIVYGPRKLTMRTVLFAIGMFLAGVFMINIKTGFSYSDAKGAFAGWLAIGLSVLGLYISIANSMRGIPRVTLLSTGIRYEHGKFVEEARWDSLAPFTVGWIGKSRDIRAEVTGPNVSQYVERDQLFLISFPDLLDVNFDVLFDQINEYRETAMEREQQKLLAQQSAEATAPASH